MALAATNCNGEHGGAGDAWGLAVICLTPHLRAGDLFWGRSVSPGEQGSSSMQLPLKMESSTEDENWLEDQWEQW